MKVFNIYPAQILLFILCTLPVSVFAEVSLDNPFEIFEYKEEEGWKEEALKIPPLPKESDLLPFEVDKPNFNYYIDQNSISVGAKDRVSRYTVIIESPSGVRNTIYEAMNCLAQQYKMYAYSISGQKFHRFKDPKWQPITPMSTQNFRAELHRVYLCDRSIEIKNKKEIIQRIKYPPQQDELNQ